MSKKDFCKYIFGNTKKSNEIIESFYSDWKNTGYDIKLYKVLLQTRG